MAWILIPLALIVAWYLFTRKHGGLDFWKVVSKYPYAAYAMFQEQDCWRVFTEKPEGGYQASLPPGEWVGPFKLLLPMSGSTPVIIFGRVPDYEASQKDFVAMMKNGA